MEISLKYGFRYGLKQSVTIVVGYAPVAITFGILAAQYGISTWESGFMSLFVFAGAAQFIGIEMLHQGSTILMIGLTTFIVNIRHALMSLAIVPFFPKTGNLWSFALAQGLTDETFVLNSRILRDIPTEEERRWVMLGINLGAFSSWVIFTVLGGLLGENLPFNFSGFQFALLALFIVLTVSTLTRKNVFTYILAGGIAILLRLLIPGKVYLILSVILAAGIGAALRVRNGQAGGKC
jgi:4-azaleucine resistance transporter AzlC